VLINPINPRFVGYTEAIARELAMLRAGSIPTYRAALNNSDGCRPPQPKFLLCQSLPQTLQPSEFVIFVAAEDVEDLSSYSEFNADAPVDHFRFARQPPMVPFNRNLIGGLPTN
jgi:hypothetical protein